MSIKNSTSVTPHNKYQAGINIVTDDNLIFLPGAKNCICPICGEKYMYGQKTYAIIRTKPGTNATSKPEARPKIIIRGCSWNCTRKEIDRLNSLRTEEDLKKGIIYKRG